MSSGPSISHKRTRIKAVGGFLRGAAGVTMGVNDLFAAANPGTNVLEATLGVAVSGPNVGQDLTVKERVLAGALGTLEIIPLIDGVGNVARTNRDVNVMHGSSRGESRPVGTRTRGAASGEPPAPRSARQPAAPGPEVRRPPSQARSGERVIGQADLENVNEVGDLNPFLELDNFNVDLRTGQVTTSSRPGGRIDAAGERVIEEALGIQRGPNDTIVSQRNPAIGSQAGAASGEQATQVLPPRDPRSGSGEQVIGRVDLENVNDVDDLIPVLQLDNFNVDLRTGQVTTSPVSGGRIDAAAQRAIEDGLTAQPGPADTRIRLGDQTPEAPAGVQRGPNDTIISQRTNAPSDPEVTTTQALTPEQRLAAQQRGAAELTQTQRPPDAVVVGRIDPQNVNDADDLAPFTRLESYSVDPVTGVVSARPRADGRIYTKSGEPVDFADITTTQRMSTADVIATQRRPSADVTDTQILRPRSASAAADESIDELEDTMKSQRAALPVSPAQAQQGRRVSFDEVRSASSVSGPANAHAAPRAPDGFEGPDGARPVIVRSGLGL